MAQFMQRVSSAAGLPQIELLDLCVMGTIGRIWPAHRERQYEESLSQRVDIGALAPISRAVVAHLGGNEIRWANLLVYKGQADLMTSRYTGAPGCDAEVG